MRWRTAMLALGLGATAACSWRDVRLATPPTAASGIAASGAAKQGGPVIDHLVKTIDGAEIALSSYRGKVLLLVNTASQCGLTPQYEALEKLHETYAARGFAVLGFPCNDFGGQEPGSAEDIKAFCSTKFQVSFPLFEKVRAKGEKSPLYRTLTEEIDPALCGEIKWNFTKFLVDSSGHVVARFEPLVKPLDPAVTEQIERLLPQ